MQNWFRSNFSLQNILTNKLSYHPTCLRKYERVSERKTAQNNSHSNNYSSEDLKDNSDTSASQNISQIDCLERNMGIVNLGESMSFIRD